MNTIDVICLRCDTAWTMAGSSICPVCGYSIQSIVGFNFELERTDLRESSREREAPDDQGRGCKRTPGQSTYMLPLIPQDLCPGVVNGRS